MSTPAVLLDHEVIKREIVVSIVDQLYTLAASDDGTWLRTISSAPVTITIPAQIDEEFAAYSSVRIERAGNGLVTIVGDGGVTVNTPTDLSISAKWGVIELKRVDVNEWTLVNVSADPPRILDINYLFFAGGYVGNEDLWLQHFLQEWVLPANFDGSYAHLRVAPTAVFTVTLRKDGTAIGTCSFAIGSLVGVFSVSAATDLNGSTFSVTGPAVPDATANGLHLSLVPI